MGDEWAAYHGTHDQKYSPESACRRVAWISGALHDLEHNSLTTVNSWRVDSCDALAVLRIVKEMVRPHWAD